MDKSKEDRLDEQIDKMFDEVTEVRTGEDGKPVPDFTKACHDFRVAQRRFDHWDQQPDKYSDKWVRMEWWTSLNRLSETERRVWRMFVGTEPTPKDNAQYCEFRKLLLEGKPTKANA